MSPEDSCPPRIHLKYDVIWNKVFEDVIKVRREMKHTAGIMVGPKSNESVFIRDRKDTETQRRGKREEGGRYWNNESTS